MNQRPPGNATASDPAGTAAAEPAGAPAAGEFSLEQYLNRRVVLDTDGPIIYIGTLRSVSEGGFWLTDADLHDRSEGHSTKEQYVSEARDLARAGTMRVNRRRVHVERRAVISVSALDEVVNEDQDTPVD